MTPAPEPRPAVAGVSEATAFPSLGFARGSIVRLFGQGPNMLVIRSGLGTAAGRTVCVLCEGDEPGGARLKDFATDELEITLSDAGRLDAEFDLRWAADMRAIKRWQAEAPGRDLTWPDHTDLTVWLLEQLAAAQVRQTERDAEVERLKAENERLRLGQEYLRLERDEAEARASKAVEVLRQVEFDPGGVCPCCSKFEGHHSSCALRAALLSTAPDLGGDATDTTRGGSNGR